MGKGEEEALTQRSRRTPGGTGEARLTRGGEPGVCTSASGPCRSSVAEVGGAKKVDPPPFGPPQMGGAPPFGGGLPYFLGIVRAPAIVYGRATVKHHVH